MCEKCKQWLNQMAVEEIARGGHVPHDWRIVQRCTMESTTFRGWYAIGVDAAGVPIRTPCNLSFGPYSTRDKAESGATETLLLILTIDKGGCMLKTSELIRQRYANAPSSWIASADGRYFWAKGLRLVRKTEGRAAAREMNNMIHVYAALPMPQDAKPEVC